MSSAIFAHALAQGYIADATFVGLATAEFPTVTDVTFEGCTFEQCDLEAVRFTRCTFEQCSFEQCNLSRAELMDCRFIETQFDSCKVLGVGFSRVQASVISAHPFSFRACRMDFCGFQGVAAPRSSFIDCSLREVDFTGSDLTGADLAGSDLRGAVFVATDLRGSSFVGAHDYLFDVRDNRVSGARFDASTAATLLQVFGIQIS